MKSQQVFLNSLLDFSNIPSKRGTDMGHYHMVSISQANKSNVNQSKKSHTDRISQLNRNTQINRIGQTNQINRNQQLHVNQQKLSQSDILGNNQKLLKSFNNLRDKLSITNRQNILLKQQLCNMQNQLKQTNKKEQFYINQITQLNKRSQHQQQQINQYKIRLSNIKQQKLHQQHKLQQLSKNQINIQSLIQQNTKLKQQIKLSLEISIKQKIHLQQQIQSLKLKNIHQSQSHQNIQNELNLKNTQYIKLQNQFKKLKLLYDQQIFNKKINSQSVILHKQNQQLKLYIDELESKLKKQKNKKYQLQTKLLQLQEKVRLFGTRTDIYEGQLSTVMKKIKQVQKQHNSAVKQANSALNQKLSWQQKFYHSTIILEQLISRVKRQLKGDAVQLARTCQFRLNKLKNGQKLDLLQKPFNKKSKSSSKKIRSQSQKKQQHQTANNQENKLNLQTLKFVSFSNTQQNDFRPSSTKKQQFSKTVLKQKPQSNIILNTISNNGNNGLEDVKKKLFTELPTGSKSILSNNMASSSKLPTNQLNLQAKIRKQRELMERKLRQKILYHKIQDATSSPLKNRLRQQYFNINALDIE